MTKRIVLAGLLGGIAMYLWVSLAHMVLPLGGAGIKEIPNEQALLPVLQSTLGSTPGLYLYPGMGLGPNATRQQQRAAMSQYAQRLGANPSGILMYNPPGRVGISARMLLTEFAVELLEVMLAVFLLAQTRLRTYLSRVAFIAAIGVVAALSTNVSYWNWYGFPASYTAAYMITQFVGFLCAGLVAAPFVRTAAAATRATTA